MSIADSFLAHVRFLKQDEGGRRRSPRNPAVSQLSVPPIQTSCYLVALDPQELPLDDPDAIPLGKTVLVRVVAWDAVHYQAEFDRLGPEIEFFEGARRVARGRMIEGRKLEPTPETVEAFLQASLKEGFRQE